MERSWIRVIASVLVLTVIAVACGGEPAGGTPPKSTGTGPTVAPSPRPTSAPGTTSAGAINPGKVTWLVGDFGSERFDYAFNQRGHSYARQIHAFMISIDVKDGRTVLSPGIATEWAVSSNGLTWNLTIRKGVKFHNGTEVTTEDVLWSLLHTLGPQAKEYSLSSDPIWPLIDRIEQTAPDRVSVTTKNPVADFNITRSEATGGWASVVMPKRATVHDVKEEEAYDRNPIGAGIMRLVKHVPADSMTLERFADYYHQPKNGFSTDKTVKFTTLELRLVPEEAIRVAALRAGQADFAPVSLSGRQSVEAGGGRLVFGPESAYFMILQVGCMKAQVPCSDQRVRLALNYAMDRKLLRDRLYGGLNVMQIKGWGTISPSTTGYSPELDPLPFDPVKARQLLTDAGYPGGKGFGKLIINTWSSESVPLMVESAQLGAEFWRKELGLDVEVKVADAGAITKQWLQTEELYGQILWRDNDTRPDGVGLLRAFYNNPNAPSRLHDNPELVALVQKAQAVFDPVEREKVLNSTYRRMRDEAYEISLGYVNIPWAVGSRVLTWEPRAMAFYPSSLHTITLK